jgi:phosphatidylethanolamine/phosphatidyl-N-methylethanolamine N-methyltransferase
MTGNTAAQHLDFLKGLIARPKNVGAIAPSSPALARAIAREVDPGPSGPVLELGPGTGVVTEALIERGVGPERITAIEYDPEFAALVATRFPQVRVVRGDAFDLAKTLATDDSASFTAIVSGLPLLNFPLEQRQKLLDQIFARLAPGAPFVQFSYGMHPPVTLPGVSVTRAAVIWLNLPPARVWTYRRA